MTKISTTTAGIDAAKSKLDIEAIYGRAERWQLDNTSHGWRRLAADLARAGVLRVGIEATGGYERELTLEDNHPGRKSVIALPSGGPVQSAG